LKKDQTKKRNVGLNPHETSKIARLIVELDLASKQGRNILRTAMIINHYDFMIYSLWKPGVRIKVKVLSRIKSRDSLKYSFHLPKSDQYDYLALVYFPFGITEWRKALVKYYKRKEIPSQSSKDLDVYGISDIQIIKDS